MQRDKTTPLLNTDEDEVDDIWLPQELQSPSNMSLDVRQGASPISVVEQAEMTPQPRQPSSPLTRATKLLKNDQPSVNDVMPSARYWGHDVIVLILIAVRGFLDAMRTMYPGGIWESEPASYFSTAFGYGAAIKSYATLDRVGKTTQSVKQTVEEIIDISKATKAEISDIKTEISDIKSEMATKTEISDIKSEMATKAEAINNKLDMIIDRLDPR